MLAALKAAKAYLIGGVILALLLALGAQTVRLAGSQRDVETVRRERAEERDQRSRAALRDLEKVAANQAVHAATQQGIEDELHRETLARQAAERSNGDLGRGLRDATAAASRYRKEARANAAACRDQVDRPDPFDGLFVEAGDLLARSADLQEEARGIVTRRDSEVKALKAVVENDRKLAHD